MAAKRKAKKSTKRKPKLTPVPPNLPTPTPYFVVHDADAALAFYKKAFGGKETLRLADPSGKVMHAEIKIATVTFMLCDEIPSMGMLSPKTIGQTPTGFHFYVPNADKAVKKAVAAGATLERAAAVQFYGDCSGAIIDPFGYRWMISHRAEPVPYSEVKKRWKKMMANPKPV